MRGGGQQYCRELGGCFHFEHKIQNASKSEKWSEATYSREIMNNINYCQS